MKAISLVFAILLLVLGGCSTPLSTFTRSIYADQNLTDNDLKRIQFFLSDDLILYRKLPTNANIQIDRGSLSVKTDEKTEEIVIKRGTPGVFVSRPDADHLAISFDASDDSKYLMFGPNPKNGGVYELLASEWNRRTGTVTYANEKFKTYCPVIPHLLIDLKQSQAYLLERNTLRGRKVDGK